MTNGVSNVKYSYLSVSLGVTSLLQIPQAYIAIHLVRTRNDLLIILTSVLLTVAAMSIISLMASNYLEDKMLIKFYAQPAIVGSLIVNSAQWIGFLWIFLELIDHPIFANNVINLYVFSQTVTFTIMLLAVAYLSKS